MEHRQRIEDDVARVEVHDRTKLMTVRQQIAVTQDNALRRAFRSGREEHHRGLIGPFGSMVRSRGDRTKQGTETTEQSNLSTNVFEVEHRGLRRERIDHRFQLGLLDELPRRDDQLDLRSRARRLRRSRTSREVEHRGHATVSLEPKERDDRCPRCW